MSRKHNHRLYLLFVMIAGLSLVVSLTLYALRQNINIFYTPSQIEANEVAHLQLVRVGGMVVEGSIERLGQLKVKFTLTDYAHTVDVFYDGILPDLFREGQGVVTEGKLTNMGFMASMVLAKHDENYMPKEVRDTLKRSL